MYLKFKNKKDYLQWDKKQFFDHCKEQKKVDSNLVVKSVDSVHGQVVLGMKNGQIVENIGYDTSWTSCFEKNGSDEVIVLEKSARLGYADKAKKNYGAIEISFEDAVNQGFIERIEYE